MIKKLRFRFILVSLLSILFVLSATIGAINIYNYSKVEQEGEVSLNQIIDKGFNNEPFQGGPGGPGGRDDNRVFSEIYFLISFDNDGNVKQSDFKHIFAISETQGIELATDVFNGNVTKGKYYDYRYKKANKNSETYVAFVDIKNRLDGARDFLTSSIVVSSISYLALAGLIVLASFIVFKTSEESYKKQKRFITNASHELKTPLTIISTDLEIIEMDNGKSEWTESIRDQINRLTNMTNQLVTLSKIDEEDKNNYPFEEFSLTSLANQCLETFAPSFDKQELNLTYKIEEDVIYHGNKKLIDELLYIFLDNALKYAKEKGNVSVEVKKNNKNINISFTNDIDENSQIDVKQLFDRFYRSPDVKKSGSGIGLSIASEIIRIHKGNIKAKVIDNQIIFEITL